MGPGLSHSETNSAIDNMQIDFGFDDLPDSQTKIVAFLKDSYKRKKESNRKKSLNEEESKEIFQPEGEEDFDFHLSEFLNLMIADDSFLFEIIYEIDMQTFEKKKIKIDMEELRKRIMENEILMDKIKIEEKILVEKHIVEHPPSEGSYYLISQLINIPRHIISTFILPNIPA